MIVKRRLTHFFVCLLGIACVPSLVAAQTSGSADSNRNVFPDESWTVADDVKSRGWSQEKLKEAKRYAEGGKTAAVVIVQGGVIISQWGKVDHKYVIHSMRKSLLSGMIGVHAANGNIELNSTLETLGIDDIEPALSVLEKQATVHDLIRARSGIYHDACAETDSMKASKPARHRYRPGEHWYYNNWDFNALGAIFTQQTKTDIFEEFDRLFARPLAMQDFVPGDGIMQVAPEESRHGAYHMRMTARDLARFGLLFLRGGRWNNQQLISHNWVRESTGNHSRIGPAAGYGYMWWTGTKDGLLPGVDLKGHCYAAMGVGGHALIVMPDYDLVFVHRVDTDKRHSVGGARIGRLLHMILDAGGYVKPNDERQTTTVSLTDKQIRRWTGTYRISGDNPENFELIDENKQLIMVSARGKRYRLSPRSPTQFQVPGGSGRLIEFRGEKKGTVHATLFEGRRTWPINASRITKAGEKN